MTRYGASTFVVGDIIKLIKIEKMYALDMSHILKVEVVYGSGIDQEVMVFGLNSTKKGIVKSRYFEKTEPPIGSREINVDGKTYCVEDLFGKITRIIPAVNDMA
jgi:hypothetical protein